MKRFGLKLSSNVSIWGFDDWEGEISYRQMPLDNPFADREHGLSTPPTNVISVPRRSTHTSRESLQEDPHSGDDELIARVTIRPLALVGCYHR